MAGLLSITDIYNKFAFEWLFSRDTIQWQAPVHLLLGDIQFYETGDHFANRMTPEDLNKRLSTIHQAAMKRVPYTVNYDLQVQGDKIAKIQEQGRVFFNQDGQMLLCRGYIRSQDIRNQENKDHACENEIISALDKMLEEDNPSQQKSAFLYFCIDRLPLVAIRFGTEVSEKLMSQVEELLNGMVRDYDKIGRISGTSFGIILRNCDHNEIIVVAKRLVEILERSPLQIDNQRLIISSSIGGAVLQHAPGITSHAILQHAERALMDTQQIKRVNISPAMAAKQMTASHNAVEGKRRTEDLFGGHN